MTIGRKYVQNCSWLVRKMHITQKFYESIGNNNGTSQPFQLFMNYILIELIESGLARKFNLGDKACRKTSHQLQIESAYFGDELKSDTLLALTHKSNWIQSWGHKATTLRDGKNETLRRAKILQLKSLQNHDEDRKKTYKQNRFKKVKHKKKPNSI